MAYQSVSDRRREKKKIWEWIRSRYNLEDEIGMRIDTALDTTSYRIIAYHSVLERIRAYQTDGAYQISEWIRSRYNLEDEQDQELFTPKFLIRYDTA